MVVRFIPFRKETDVFTWKNVYSAITTAITLAICLQGFCFYSLEL